MAIRSRRQLVGRNCAIGFVESVLASVIRCIFLSFAGTSVCLSAGGTRQVLDRRSYTHPHTC
jgi:hypothetical protein